MYSQELFYFSIVLLGLLMVLTGLCLYLIIKKMMDNKKRVTIEKYKEEYQSALFQYLQEGVGDEGFQNSSPLQTRALVELLAGFSKVISSPGIQERLQWFAENHFQPFILSQLRHRRWSIRMNALYWIQDFKMRSMKEPLKELRGSGYMSKSEEIQLLKLDVLFDDQELLPRLTDTKHELTEFEYSLLFQSFGKDQFQPLVYAFDELPEVMKFALIDSIGVMNRMEHVGFLERLLSEDSTELRVRALKAVVGMEFYLNVPKLSSHLRAESWQERLMALKACEYIRSPKLTPYLKELMSDPSFYVRSQAAQSLLRLADGKVVLGEIAVHAEDEYARDMAEQWLERGAVT
ncbi:HEAT repeat domain-containing protein [Rossellomorea aquimaris]|uniref:HEAT repeat domain-containing protein n=1 Tax=Rossellomorea TaxID=2837508 RepID=UPI001CD74EC2|nr:HEAT repeat domain-containing protein [Rossellomorea aquimaris]MCA1061303.1 HEAT repeat domain-containing protein [Rossellomorea aquimaris]